MKSEILVIAEAILANIKVIEMLIHKLPDSVKAEVAAVVEKATPMQAPVTTMPAHAAPFTTPVTPVVEPVTPVLVPMSVPVPAAVTVPATDCPIKSAKDLMDYVMSSYKALGAEKGSKIQGVLNSVGCAAINEVRPDQYAALFAGIEGLKA